MYSRISASLHCWIVPMNSFSVIFESPSLSVCVCVCVCACACALACSFLLYLRWNGANLYIVITLPPRSSRPFKIFPPRSNQSGGNRCPPGPTTVKHVLCVVFTNKNKNKKKQSFNIKYKQNNQKQNLRAQVAGTLVPGAIAPFAVALFLRALPGRAVALVLCLLRPDPPNNNKNPHHLHSM